MCPGSQNNYYLQLKSILNPAPKHKFQNSLSYSPLLPNRFLVILSAKSLKISACGEHLLNNWTNNSVLKPQF